MKPLRDLVARVPKFESCGVCSKDGFIAMTRNGPDGNPYDELVRCRCFKAHQEKLARELSAVSENRKRKI